MVDEDELVGLYKTKVREFYDFHKNEGAKSAFKLPNTYEEFVEKDLDTYLNWLLDHKKYHLVGNFYSIGVYVEKNVQKAFSYYKKGVKHTNDHSSNVAIGICYHRGRGTEKNLEKAVIHFSRALELQKNDNFSRKNMNSILDKNPMLYKVLYQKTEKKLVETQKSLKETKLKLKDAEKLIDNHFDAMPGGPEYNQVKERWGEKVKENDE